MKHLQERVITDLNQRFKSLKQLQSRHEDNLKEVREDERIEREYQLATQEWERLFGMACEFADVIDANTLTGKYVLQEDKSLQTKMIIKKKQGGAITANEAGDEFYPFDDELQHKFYRDLPDLSRFVGPPTTSTS